MPLGTPIRKVSQAYIKYQICKERLNILSLIIYCSNPLSFMIRPFSCQSSEIPPNSPLESQKMQPFLNEPLTSERFWPLGDVTTCSFLVG